MGSAGSSPSAESIVFEGTPLPPVLLYLSILIVEDALSQETRDWIWKFVHCHGVEKSGDAGSCRNSAAEISDCLLENRERLLAFIEERLGPLGFDPTTAYGDWMEGLRIIQEKAAGTEGSCHWVRDEEGFDRKAAELKAKQFLDFFDRLDQGLLDPKDWTPPA